MTGRLLTPKDVAEKIGVKVKTIYNWRAQRPVYGPPAIKVGKYLRWRPADVDAWINAQAGMDNVTPIRRSA